MVDDTELKWYEYNNQIPRNTLQNWHNHFMDNTDWRHVGWTGEAKEPLRHWAAYPAFEGEIKNVWNLLNDSFKEDGFNLVPDRIILNLYNHGDSSWLHRDTDDISWTAILYLNLWWDINWGGDTILVEDDEIVKAFAATPGKFILFRGDMMHGARPVSREAPYPRLGLTFQCANTISQYI